MKENAHHHNHPPTSAHHHAAAFDSDRMAVLLDVEGELAAGITDQAIAHCVELSTADVRRVVDLGCGPGVATASLAATFPDAIIVGVDGSAAILKRAAVRAEQLGVSARVDLHSLDLDDDLRELGDFDLAWAALALHHTADEQASLTNFVSLIRPGGLLCLLERAEPTVIHPAHDFGRPGIWDRVADAQSAHHEQARESLPGATNVDSYAAMIEQTGLELLDQRTLIDTLEIATGPRLQPTIHRYLATALRNLRNTLPSTDVDALSHGSEHIADIAWGDTLVTSTRTLFIARHAGAH